MTPYRQPIIQTKRRNPNPMHPKDWDRRARVVAALSERRMSLTELSALLEVSPSYVSTIIWGRRRLASAEKAIAKALHKSRAELFGPDGEKRGAA